MLLEADLVPYISSSPIGDRVLILAPHPDDETLGCGGALKLLLKSKKQVKVIFLTSGDKADPSNPKSYTTINHEHYHPPLIRPASSTIPSPLAGEDRGEGEFNITEYALLREKEAVRALSVLGVSDYEFFRFPDRELHMHYQSALDRVLNIVRSYMPDAVYSPSMIELNPDHRTTAALAIELQKMVMNTDINTLIHDAPPPHPYPQGKRVRMGVMPVKLVFYEVTTPLRPNILVDISSVYNVKKSAIKKYKSQIKLANYLECITALNTFRSLTINKSRKVEAFWIINKPLSEDEVTRWLIYR